MIVGLEKSVNNEHRLVTMEQVEGCAHVECLICSIKIKFLLSEILNSQIKLDL